MKPQPRLLRERAIEGEETSGSKAVRPIRSVTVNLTESPLGWLLSRGLVTQRQYDAGERLRADWERSQLAPRVTMSWDAAPVSRGRGGSALEPDLSGAQIDARTPFRPRDRQRRPGPGRHPLAHRLRRRRHARCRNRARLAGARGQAGADVRARPGRGLLPSPLAHPAHAGVRNDKRKAPRPGGSAAPCGFKKLWAQALSLLPSMSELAVLPLAGFHVLVEAFFRALTLACKVGAVERFRRRLVRASSL